METYTIEDLVWAIMADEGQFSLFFARCNYRKLRDEMMQQLRESCNITEMELAAEDESFYRKLKAFVTKENPMALMVYGFENVENIVKLLVSMNNLREKFVADFSFPIVCWVNDTIIGRFEELAMDFKSFGKPIALLITEEAVRVNLQDKIEFFFQEFLKVCGDEFIPNEAILGNAYRSEIDSALADLRQFEADLSQEIEGSLELIRGREAFAKKQVEEARSYYQNTAQLWQDVKDISPLKEAVVLFHLGTCDRFSAEEAEEKEEQRNYWLETQRHFTNCLDKLQGDSAAMSINELGEVYLCLENWQSLQDLGSRSVELQKKCNNLVQLARAYGFLAQVAIQEKNWQEAKLQVELALETINRLPSVARKNKGVYLLLSAQVREYLEEHEESVKEVEEGIAIAIDGKPYYFLQLLEELRQLYFGRKYYLEAYKIKIEYQSIRQQYGLTAFVGAGRVKASKTQNYKVSGRQGDIDRLMDRIANPKNKLTIIYGQSGVGKSSLVEAGLVPTLREQKRIDNRDLLVVNLRVYTNWIEELQRSLFEEVETKNSSISSSPLNNEGVRKTGGSSLSDILEQLDANGNNYAMMVLVFDQFEEFFFVSQTPARRRQFFEFFRDCLDRVFVKIVLSLREDYLYLLLQGTRNLDLGAINNDLLDKDILYYVGNFSRRSAIAVIDELTCNSRFHLESDLTTQLIEDLATELGEVRPIELQITGAQLQRETIRTLSQYQQIREDPKEKLVREYLENVVRDSGYQNQDIAHLVLSLLVDEKSNTRPLKTKQELETALVSLQTGDKLEKLTLVLDIFVLSGLVVLLPEQPADRYQLVHDYLVDVIRQQQGASLLAQLKQAEEKMEIEKNAKLRWFKVLQGVLVGLTIIAGVALKFGIDSRRESIRAKNQEVVSLSQLAKANYSSNPYSLDSLMDALKTGIRAKQGGQDIKPENRRLAIDRLYQAVYQGTIQERNRLEKDRFSALKVAWNPSKNILASGHGDGTINIWDSNGKLLHTSKKHEDYIQSLAWSPDGTTLASTSWDKTIRIWNSEGQLLHTIKTVKGSGEIALSIAWSSDGKILTSGYTGGSIKFWSRMGKPLKALEGHKIGAHGLAWNPDGSILASVGSDGMLKMWSRDGELVQNIKEHNTPLSSVAWSPDGQMLASGGLDHTINIWNQEGELLHTLEGHQNDIWSIVWNPDGKTLASAGADKTIKIWNQEGELLHTLEGHQEVIPSIAWSSDGKTLASASIDRTIRIWDWEQKFIKSLNAHEKQVGRMVWNPNGKTFASSSEDRIKVWNKQGKLLHISKENLDTLGGYFFANLEWSPDGQNLISSSGNGDLRIWNQKGELLQTIQGHRGNFITAISVIWHPNGKLIASGGQDGVIKIWNRKGELLRTLKGHINSISDLQWSPDGKILISASSNGNIKLWNQEDHPIHVIDKNQSGWTRLMWSPNENVFISITDGKYIKIWSREAQLLHTLEGVPDNTDASLTWHPNGNLFASAHGNSIKIWSQEGHPLLTIEGRELYGVEWSADGETLAIVKANGNIVLWDDFKKNFDLDKLLIEGCNRVKYYLQYNNKLNEEERKLCDTTLSDKKSNTYN
ncbi:MAG: AAA family ATPase [Cyanobacteria bacterium P01_E01_bin.42]